MKKPLLTRRAFLAAAASLVTAAGLSACDSRLLRRLFLARAEQTAGSTQLCFPLNTFVTVEHESFASFARQANFLL